jgi:hypothetical protein
MAIAPATGDTTAGSVEEQFLDLICSDVDLLAAEFDAIITAEWPEPPPSRPGRGAAGGNPDGAVHRAAGSVRGAASRPRHPGIGGWARQRSPPFFDLTHDRQEGRWSPGMNPPARGDCSPRPHVPPPSV